MIGITTKTILDNGLTIVLKEMHHAPVACFMVWYRVGSRNEHPGTTGISHWIEHLLFSGTPTFPGSECDRLISREGGYWNAFTGLDYTAYYETIPAEKIGLCLAIESDRMVHANMNIDDVEMERSIILSERAMYENDPRFLLYEELTSIAFRVHPYHHEVIGDETDLKTMSRDDLINHYRHYYVPNNAVIVATGDFNSVRLVEQIKEFFGGIPASDGLSPVTRMEPAQRGERRVTVNGPGDAAHLTFAYHAPAANHPDYLPLVLLNAIFAGGSSLGTFSGGGSNRSSRLYKAFVNTGLAAAVSGSLSPTIDPFLYSIDIVVNQNVTLQEVESVLDKEIMALNTIPITKTDLERALKRAKAEFVLAGESITGQAHLLGLAEIVADDFSWYELVLDRLAHITLDDLNRVLQTYVSNQYRCVGWYQPELESQGE